MTIRIDQSISAILAQWGQQLAAAVAAAPPDADKFDYPAVVDGKPVIFRGCHIIDIQHSDAVPIADGDVIEITMRFDQQTAAPRKLDLGRFPVCSKCGQSALRNHVVGLPSTATCATCGPIEVMTLRRYVTEVRGETFDADKWKMEFQDLRQEPI